MITEAMHTQDRCWVRYRSQVIVRNTIVTSDIHMIRTNEAFSCLSRRLKGVANPIWRGKNYFLQFISVWRTNKNMIIQKYFQYFDWPQHNFKRNYYDQRHEYYSDNPSYLQ